MRIAQLAPPFASVPPVGYGGTERVVSTLTDELVRRGHDVTLFAAGDSRTSARLMPIVDKALWDLVPPCNDFAEHRDQIYAILANELDEFDVVHNHMDYLGFQLAELTSRPLVTTLHGRLDDPRLWPTYRAFAELPLVSISDAQRGPLASANWLATVHHGIDLEAFTFNPSRGQYLAFLGRISPDKGLDVAIRVARRAGWPLMIAARPPLSFIDSPEWQRDREYFEQVIQPLLHEPGIEIVGEVDGADVDGADKDRFLGQAAALLFPIRWPEPFGLVMPESLACGTPVVAFRQGSVSEVLQHGVTGFVGHLEDDLVRAVARLDEIDRGACRLTAERRFSLAAMANAYERVFSDVLDASPPREPAYA